MSELDVVVGIDPGVKGGFAVLTYPFAVVDWYLMPRDEKEVIGLVQATNDKYNVRLWALERVWGRKGEGAAGINTFMQGYGLLRGCLLMGGCSIADVLPKEWHEYAGIESKRRDEKKREFKDRIKDFVKSSYPSLELWDENLGVQRAICDAVLIGEYGWTLLGEA